jgi:peptidoglycan/LPS O-acetylase OafA/YrhL
VSTIITTSEGTPAWGTRRGPVVPYIPGLDGLRAIAVIAVIMYHANHSWLGGGFIGVEVFFVISGYLITLLLIAERERTGGVVLGNFWWRRARRLLPALWTLLVGISVYCAFFEPDRLGMLRGDVVGAFTYVTNWFQVWTGSSYSDAFAFAPLRHLWSLAVEEQFYIVWPFVMYMLLRRVRHRSLPTLGLWFFTIAVALTVFSVLMYRPGTIGTIAQTPEQYFNLFGRDVLRVDFLYLSTISRASGLLLGASLACVWRPWKLIGGRVAYASAPLDLLGVLAIGALAWMAWTFREVVVTVDNGRQGYDLLFQGGFFLIGVASVVTIVAVTHPRSNLGRWIVGNPLFVWIGVRSYGLYLYHWPVFQAYRKIAGKPLTTSQFVWLMAITLVITELSYRFIEVPIRRGTFLKNIRSRPELRQRLTIGVVATSLLPIFAVASLATADVKQDDITATLNENEDAVTNVLASTTSIPTQSTGVTTPSVNPSTKIDVLAVGDSVMLGAANLLRAKGVTVDAQKNRQFRESLQIFNYLKATGELGDNVVIHLGTNGPMSEASVTSAMKPLADVRRVVVLTNRIPGSGWEKKNNALINALPATYPNVQILDWFTLTSDRKGLFAADGVHLSDAGRDFYIAQILGALGR